MQSVVVGAGLPPGGQAGRQADRALAATTDARGVVIGPSMAGVASMSTWLDAPEGAVAARVDRPSSGEVVGSVVLIPPYGLERVVAFRAIRALGLEAARAGFLAVGIDLPGDGDSPKPPARPFAEAWPPAAAAAVGYAREVAPGCPVHVVGLRSGACIAAGIPAAPGERRLLWEPASGRATLRRLMSMRRVAVPQEPLPGLVELAANALTVDEATALRALSLPARAADAIEVRREPPAVAAELVSGSPRTARIPYASIQSIVDDLPRGHVVPVDLREGGSSQVASVAPGVRERLLTIGPHRLRAVVTEPDPGTLVGPAPESSAVLAFTAMGSELSSGPGDLYAVAARDWATRGVRSIRADRRGLGDALDVTEATERPPYTDAGAEDAAELVRAARRLSPGAKVLAVGVCAGAWCLLRAAETEPPDAILAVNSVHWARDEAHYDEDFYARFHLEDRPSVGAVPRRWRSPRSTARYRSAERSIERIYPRLVLWSRPQDWCDRVGRLLRRIPLSVAVHVLGGDWESRLFRAKGGGWYLHSGGHSAPRARLHVDHELDHSLISEAARRDVVAQLAAILAGWDLVGPGMPDVRQPLDRDVRLAATDDRAGRHLAALSTARTFGLRHP